MSAASIRKKKKKLSSKKRRQSVKLQQGREDEERALEAIVDERSLRTRNDLFVVDTGRGVSDKQPDAQKPNYVVHSKSNRSTIRRLTKRMLEGDRDAGRRVVTEHRSLNTSVWDDDAVLLPIARKRSRTDFQIPNSRKTLELPGHGESYNPDQHHHQNLMGKAAAFKVARLGRESKLRDEMKVPAEILSGAGLDDGVAQMKAYLTAIQTGAPLGTEEEEESSASSDDSEDYELPGPKKPTKRKTKRQRQAFKRKPRVSKKKQRLDREQRLAVDLALFDQDFDSPKVGQSRSERRADDSRVKRIGKRRYQEKMVDVLLPSELPSSLRRVDTLAVTNPFAHQYRAFQARNLVPVTVHHSKQKRNIKFKVKRRRERERIKALEKKGITDKQYKKFY